MSGERGHLFSWLPPLQDDLRPATSLILGHILSNGGLLIGLSFSGFQESLSLLSFSACE